MEAVFWLGMMVVLCIIELATMGLTTIWFAAGALAACIVALIQGNIWIQTIVFLLVSILLLIFTRPVAVKYLNHSRIKTNIESLIGREAVVLQPIENLKIQGKVLMNGMEWTARTASNQDIIEKDTIVVVERVEGVKLIVKRKEVLR